MRRFSAPFPTGSSFVRLRPRRGLIRSIRKAERAARAVPREELSPAGIWIEDHARFLLSEADALNRSLRHCPRLPGERGTPRVLLLARELCAEGEGELTAPLILRFARQWLAGKEITSRELDMLPDALRLALFEALGETLKTCAKEAALRKKAMAWASGLISGRWKELPGEEGLLFQTLEILSAREEGLQKAGEMLKGTGITPDEAARREREALTREGMRAGRIISSLRQMGRLPFDRIRERLSPVAAILREEETYRRMDAESRGYYRQRVSRIAKKLRVKEMAAARAALDLAWGKKGAQGEAGYYLIERPDLMARELRKKRLPSFLYRHREGLFVMTLYGGAALALAAGVALGAPWYLWPIVPMAASEIVRRGVYFVIRRRFPPRLVPRLRVKRLNRENRTLAVVPTLLTSRKQALHMARQLAVLRCADPDPYLDFMLLGDFADSETENKPEDEEILSAARESVDALNDRWGGGFLYLHRARKWDAGQRRYTGRERKRGALEALNRLIAEGKASDRFLYASCDPASLRGRYAYVITLDADTFLPPGAAHQLVGAMEHPLQKGRVGVIQPRMETAADSVRTRAQFYLGGRDGVDPYHLAAQDVYQDAFGQGSFVGKGIYAPEKWLSALAGRLPSGRLLSHDLIEGEIVRSALMPDTALYDGHPAKLAGWQKRLHRWTRGDWQLLPFLFDRRLSLLSRHKIWDNLRRSLLPAAQAMGIALGAGLNLPLLMLLCLPWPLRGMEWRLFLLPAKAFTNLDAACRALYRQFYSHRNLLSWVTAAQAEDGSGVPLSCVLAQVLMGTGTILLSLLPGGCWAGALAGMAWAAAPLLTGWMDAPLPGGRPMTRAMAESMRALGRATWRFFEDTVNEKTLFLPPDNVQTDPDKGPALRTSPTNAGLYLLSCCAARELGYITTADMARRVSDALGTLEKMDRWRGHFYNWYDLTNGAPLPPPFVSTVDSGNLAGCLMACAQLFRSRLAELKPEERSIPARLDALARGMDFAALYDEKERLFRVGWDVRANRPTPAHYDLLASEARLTSFIAVMTGQVEREHWARLNRSAVYAGGGPALLSWGGTMFEYLMPHLLLPLYPGTLMGEGCLNAVRAQMSADPRRPFGISESGYYAFDADMNYQYRAFGLPCLALSSETAGSVIAPYASMLALPFFPRAAAENLKRMQRLGWQDEHGLFEAADMSPGRVEGSPRIIKSHMAHHQGMILCAVCNALSDQRLVRAFMTPPQARAYAYLLQEKPPAGARRRPAPPPPRKDDLQPGLLRRKALAGLPMDAHALAGGGTTWVMASNGQGYLAVREGMITRFDDEAGAQTGPQFYLRDEGSGRAIRPAVRGETVFEGGCVRFSAEWAGLRAILSCCVDPLTGMAVARVQVENPGDGERTVEAASFLEIAQGPRAADEAHPNFRDLSVRIEPWGSRGLLSRRLPRDEKDEMPLIGHAAVGDVFSLRRQGDRTLFLGRNGSYALPQQMEEDAEKCLFRVGDTAAPCLSLRARMRVPAGGRTNVYFVTLARRTEAELNDLLSSPARARAAFAQAQVQVRMVLRSLRMDGRMLGMYQQMLGALVFSRQPHQAGHPSAPRSALWRAGISGVLPVLLVDLTQSDGPALIRHALRAHAWLRGQGVMCDLLFFCPREDEYHRPRRDALSRLLALSPERDRQGVPGGVHIACGNETERQEMESLARLTLRSGQSLSSQLALLRTPPPMPAPGRLTLPAPLAPPLAAGFNSFGGFTAEGAYCVAAPAPAPWHNLLCSTSFGTLVCETGILHSYAGNSRLGRITRLSPDVHRGLESEEILLMDEEDRVYPLARCAVTYEPGAAVYTVRAGDTDAELAVFTHGERPLGVRMLTVKSEKEARLRVFWLVRFALGEHPETTRCRGEGGFMLAESGDMPGVAWAAWRDAACAALSPALCFGLAGESVPPALNGLPGGGGSAAVFRQEITLSPREPRRLTLVLGWAADERAAREDFDALQVEGASAALRAVREQWSRRLSALTLFSENEAMERTLNRWLPYQTLASRLMARMGPYQQGGAFGFRDQLQDLLILLYTDPEAARAHLLLCAAHQFPEGDVQHWWHAPRRGVRTRISDDKLFLPYMVSRYVVVTGDRDILLSPVPYLSSPPLLETEAERYEEPAVTSWAEPLLDHCLRAIDSVRLGRHGLPLMGAGDWNDGMNRVGGKRGESVWLGFFLALILREFAPLCPPERKENLDQMRRKLMEHAERAWTGAWYLRAWWDDGRPMGGPESDPPRIDLISQCFAVLAGAPRDHARAALSNAVERLYDREAGMVKLLDPPFSPQEGAGYIGAYIPGVRENGGQYTHAVPWLILALCRVGEYALAWEIAETILPENHSGTREKALTYRVEPYVLAGDVYAGENRGRGGWTWYTGSAAWLYYAVLTALLGFEKRGSRARLLPCPRKDAEDYTLIYRFGTASYHFTAARDCLFAALDGEKLMDGWAEMRDDGRIHEARFPLRAI